MAAGQSPGGSGGDAAIFCVCPDGSDAGAAPAPPPAPRAPAAPYRLVDAISAELQRCWDGAAAVLAVKPRERRAGPRSALRVPRGGGARRGRLSLLPAQGGAAGPRTRPGAFPWARSLPFGPGSGLRALYRAHRAGPAL